MPVAAYRIQASNVVGSVPAPVTLAQLALAGHLVNGSIPVRPLPGGCSFARIRVQEKPCRYAQDGSNPSPTAGVLVDPGDPPIVVRQEQFPTFKIVETDASAVLFVEFCMTARASKLITLSGRPYSRLQVRYAIGQRLAADPARSDRAVAEELGVDHKTVAGVRSRLESKGDIPRVTEFAGRDGKKYSRRASPLGEVR